MQEIYRSFEGKLGVDNQSGYIISELKETYQIEWLSVWGKTNKIRVRKDLLPVEDFGNASKISELFYGYFAWMFKRLHVLLQKLVV